MWDRCYSMRVKLQATLGLPLLHTPYPRLASWRTRNELLPAICYQVAINS